ncbi:acyl-CoA dehydrogenase family protein [Sphingomonas canadensis]|uniref:Acyl-[acyl-carrier-protein] dehydrogenase MbtN n=1 Tax=Sphingomonas canadensis TaxID=1219257 RepID=A0ABW3HCL9_9SPHN|nr:acyl-CoA dehydrogenase family protein [Sphingomonas canadensis]MCW3836939.1 acyl-CoA dehydrogenase family protein [Sphingomonas canadensis]
MPAGVETDALLPVFRDGVARFLRDTVVPAFGEWRERSAMPRAFFTQAGAAGILCPGVPAAFGGAEADFRFNAAVIEELARTGMSPAVLCVHSDILPGYIAKWGTPAQQAAWLPRLVTGEAVGAIAMSEPGAGSDLQAMATAARRVDGGYRISGQKTFISNGGLADLVVLAAKTDPGAGAAGISLFLIDAATPGFARGRRLRKLGMHEQDTSELFFDDMFVPEDALLGAEGAGFRIMMEELPTERLSLAVGAVAAAETALEMTIAYAKERVIFGKPLIAYQIHSFKLAELRAAVRAARAFVDGGVALHVAGGLNAVDAAEMKLFATNLQCRVVDDCLQIFGGYGYMDEYPISRMYADARVQRIYGGSDEVMKLIISRTL